MRFYRSRTLHDDGLTSLTAGLRATKVPDKAPLAVPIEVSREPPHPLLHISLSKIWHWVQIL